MTVFDDGIALQPAGDAVMSGRTDPNWANMVGPFGGITAAALLRAVELHPDVLGLPVALTVNYLAPIVDGGYTVRARAARTNRSNQHWLVELDQDGEVKATATAIFGIRRDTWSDTEITMPSVPAPEEVPAGPDIGLAWMRNYDMRYVTGAIPGAEDGESDRSETTLWVRDTSDRPWDFAALTAACDIFYPRIFLRRGRPLPAGTVSMTVYFHADTAALTALGADHVLATARAQHYSFGHFDQTAQIWGPTGSLLATTHQIVYFKG